MKCISKIRKELIKNIGTLEKHQSLLGRKYYKIKLNNKTILKIPTMWGMGWKWIDDEATIITNGKRKIKISLIDFEIKDFIEGLIRDKGRSKRERKRIDRNKKKLGQLKKLGVC